MEKEPLLLPRSNSWLQKPPPPPLFIPRNNTTTNNYNYSSSNNNNVYENNSEENNNLVEEASFPVPLTPSQLKDRIIFGPSPKYTSSFIDPFSLPSSSVISTGKPSASSPLRSKKKCLHRAKTAPAMAVLNDAFVTPSVAQKPLMERN